MNEVVDKPALIQNLVLDKNIDILFLTETWLSPDTPPSITNSLTSADYSFLHVPRLSGRGGGIAVVFKSIFFSFFDKINRFFVL
jgi:hypothetical protein